MATLTSYSLVPELQHFFRTFVINSSLNRDIVPPPTDIMERYMPENSFIEMLFNDNYSKNNYEYRYIEEVNVGCIPRAALTRLQIYPGSWSYLVIDESGDNVFNLQAHDFIALDALLAYRNGINDSTSFTFIDSTSVSFISDSTSAILTGSFSSFNTELSKLIFLYLKLKVSDDFSLYNNTSIISSGGLLETCFEVYLEDNYFKFITNMQPDLLYECQCEE